MHGCTYDDLERATRTGRMVEIKIAQREFSAAHAAVAMAHKEYLGSLTRKNRRTLELGEIGLDVRTLNTLWNAGINTLEQLAACDQEDLARIPNMAAVGIQRIAVILEALGMYNPPED